MDTTALPPAPAFSFRRMAGLDQALLLTDDEWRRLDRLDPKIWMALSCPTDGLEFDAATLHLLDGDGDGRIRAADLLAAVAWLCPRVKSPARLQERAALLPVDNLREDTPEGAEVLAAARLVLARSGAEDAPTVSREAVATALAAAAEYPFNGDGVLPPCSVAQDAPEVARFISLGLAVVGGKRDDSGLPGLDLPLAEEVSARLQQARDWRAAVHAADLPLGAATAEAWTLLQKLAPKIDDYFTRCRLADFSPAALPTLNEEADPAADNADLLSAEALRRRPLARIVPGRPVLDTARGVNPAWEEDLRAFGRLFAPLLTPQEGAGWTLDEEAWRELKARFAPYAALLAQRPAQEAAPAEAAPQAFARADLPALALAPADDPLQRAFLPCAPQEALDAVSDADLDALLDAQVRQGFLACLERENAAPRLDSLRALEKLLLLHAHLYTLLMNFLSFADFYDPDRRAIFLAGTLYIDSRSCSLCVPVADVESHTALAAQSHLCLLYCQCSRRTDQGALQTAQIAAALTAGGTAALVKGRHGVFVDNAGQVWDCSLLRVVHNPISLKEAVWAPYVRFANLVGEQMQKLVAAKDKAVASATSKTAGSLVSGVAAPTASAPAAAAPAKPPFDIAKSAGIFAALSVGISMVSASFAYIAKSLFSLGWWWPLALAGLFACISGPSALLAWFKLRRRSLGPLLDASGWAVNTGAPINLSMGASLTREGSMPPGAQRSLDDPYGLPARLGRGRSRAISVIMALLLLLGAALAASWVWRASLPPWLGARLPWAQSAAQQPAAKPEGAATPKPQAKAAAAAATKAASDDKAASAAKTNDTKTAPATPTPPAPALPSALDKVLPKAP